MPSVDDFIKYAEAAFGAYGVDLRIGDGNAQAYRVAEMAPSQALHFDSTWKVLAQQDLSDGFSATLFQEVDVSGSPVGQKVLAIRGTESSHWGIDFLADVVNVAALGTATGFSQYSSLEEFYQSLIANGKLGSLESFVVTGHSLGGFLAQAFTAKHIAVSAAYTYNSPGFSVAGGLVSNGGTQLLKLFGLSGSIPNERIFNVRALDGVSLTAGLGQMIGSVQPISIESGSPIHNHSIVTLTDSLSLYGLYGQLDSQLSLSDMDAMFRAASNRTERRLEAGLDDLRGVFLGSEAIGSNPTGVEDRESFYSNVYSLARTDEFSSRIGSVNVVSLVSKPEASLVGLAFGDVAYRYSLNALKAFAVTGSADLYDRFDEDGQLDVYDKESGAGLTGQYLSDRAAMLLWKIQDYTSDSSKVLLGDRPETYKYVDKTLTDSTGNDLTFTVRGRQVGSVGNPAFITFGSAAAETFTGSNLALGDHFYGGGGNDVLDGQGGDDYLEGGAGNDRLVGGSGDDDLYGGPGFDTYVYDEGDGFDTLSDPGGEGRVVYNGRELSGGTKVAEGQYEDSAGVDFMLLDDGEGGQSLLIDGSLYVEDFFNGALGINLDGEIAPAEAPESLSENFYFDSGLPDDFDPDSDTFGFVRAFFGTSADDVFTTAGDIPIVARTGNDVAIFDGDGEYANSIDMGAGNDFVDMGASDGGAGSGQLAGGGGNDYIIGSQGADRIWGDNYFGVSGARFGQGDVLLVDDLLYAPAGQIASGLYNGYLQTIVRAITETFGGIEDAADSVANSDGVLFDGSLEEAIVAVMGPSATFDDYIDAGDGDDTVVGGSGSDTIYGGAGDDIIFGDYGPGSASRSSGAPSYEVLESDFGPLAALFGRPGDDHMDGGEGDDGIQDIYGGNDVLTGGEGDDFIDSREMLWTPADGEGAHNVIDGGEGNDHIEATNVTGGFDVVDGGEGDDDISVVASLSGLFDEQDATPGRAIVFGGDGDDLLAVDADIAIVDGGAGDDDYTVSGESITIVDAAGDDTIHLDLVNLQQVDDWLETFPSDITLAPGWFDGMALSTTVVIQEGGDLVVATRLDIEEFEPFFTGLRIQAWFMDAGNQIEHVDTADSEGTILSSAQFAAWGGLHYGSTAADELVDASDYADRAFGGAGDDLISTGEGADRILGGTGDDVLLGGSGDDIYYYAGGDGNDMVEDTSGFDEIRFGPGISAASVTASVHDSGITLTIGQARIEVSGATRSLPGIDQLRFADGSVAAVTALLPPLPDPVAGSQNLPDPVPPQGDSSGGEQILPGGSDAASPEETQVPPQDSPSIAEESTQMLPAAETISTAAVAVVAHGTVSEPAQSGMVATSTINVPGSLFSVDSASAPFGDSEPRDADVAKVSADAPLDMQTMLDAVQSFDGNAPASGGPTQVSPGGQQANQAPSPAASGQELTSWMLTNALLQFHLDTIDGRDAGDGAADFSFIDTAFARIGASLTHQSTGLETFGSRTPMLSTFSGLQEGFTRL